MKLIIQIPCLNEAETLPLVIADLPRSIPGIDVIETLVIDDGSNDGTSDVARGLGVTHILRHETNRGLAAAFMTGIKGCLERGADIIVNTDGDHQYPGRFVAKLVKPVIDGNSQIVIGNRRPTEDGKNPPIKRLLYWLGSMVVKHAMCENAPDPVSGFRAISNKAARALDIHSEFSYTLEMILNAKAKGLHMSYVMIETNASTRPSRLCNNSFLFVIKSGMIIAKHMLLRILKVHKSLASSVSV